MIPSPFLKPRTPEKDAGPARPGLNAVARRTSRSAGKAPKGFPQRSPSRPRGALSWLGLLSLLVGAALPLAPLADDLTDALKEERSFYENYGQADYQRREVQKEIKSYYDLFGDHITDGFFIYELSQTRQKIDNDRLSDDSTFLNNSTLFESKEFKSNFNNLVVTRDAIGGSKFAFLVGDQIQTKFTPLTFNKLYFHGLRYDLWTSGLKMTTLVSRTRPDWLAKNLGSNQPNSGHSSTSYPSFDSRDSLKPYDGINQVTFDETKKIQFNDPDKSNLSRFGDYDMLFALHAENNLGNFLDYGITYINHHHSDIRQGEKWQGGLPKEYFPEEIHFEVYDLTPQDKGDAGAVVSDFRMIAGRDTLPPFDVYSPVGADSILEAFGPNQPSYSADGETPMIIVFKPKSQLGREAEQFRNLSFRFNISGNYQVFVSTDRFSHSGEATVQNNAESRIVNRRDKALNTNASNIPPMFYGDFIARSPGVVTGRNPDPGQGGHYGRPASYVYDYVLNSSSEIFGVNATARMGNFKLNTELQLNTRRYILPGSAAEEQVRRRLAGYAELTGNVWSNLGLAARAYYIAPDWNPGLDNYSVSPFYNKQVATISGQPDYSGYIDPIQPLSSNYNLLDDNEDNDQYVEGEARRYPADGGSDFFYSGALKGYKVIKVELPNKVERPYDDPDGVISDRVDKNKNGLADYREDFLLFNADPPIFELGNDLNHNGVFDQEDDDIYPDINFVTQGEFPEYNPSQVFVYTSNGFQSLGIQGASWRGRYAFSNVFSTEVGSTYEMAVADNFMMPGGGQESFLDFEQYNRPEGSQHTNFNVYNMTRYKRLQRALGLELNFENELRYVQDNIRNDAVETVSRSQFATNVSYGIHTDPLDYRKAVLDNFIIRAAYRPRNFLAATNLRLGLERRFALDDPMLVTKTVRTVDDRDRVDFEYQDKVEGYPNLDIFKFNWIGKLSYDLTWNRTYEEGWRRYLNGLKRLQITPQFKASFDALTPRFPWQGSNPLMDNPRVNPRLDPSVYNDTLAYQVRYQDYLDRNQNQLSLIPIIRVSYQVAEKTRFEFGQQWFRNYDLLQEENNFTKRTTLVQIRTNDVYKGNNVNLILGASMENFDYDLDGIGFDPLLPVGSLYDRNDFLIFARIFSGV